ncbi:type II toxin-antitoxin system toxin [Methylothermus subterraneus]
MDDVLLNKAAIIERCLKRIEEEYRGHEDELETNFTRQDAIVLNLQRACEAAIDAAMHLVRVRRLGIPQSGREAFTLLAQVGVIPRDLAEALKKMVGFRNIAVHAYQELDVQILRSILEHRLNDLRRFARCLVEVGGS